MLHVDRVFDKRANCVLALSGTRSRSKTRSAIPSPAERFIFFLHMWICQTCRWQVGVCNMETGEHDQIAVVAERDPVLARLSFC